MPYEIYIQGKITVDDPKLPEETIKNLKEQSLIPQEDPQNLFTLTITGFMYRLYETVFQEINGDEAEFSATVKMPSGEVWFVEEDGEGSMFSILRNQNFPDSLIQQIESHFS